MKSPHLSPYTEAGPLIYVSGQLAFDRNGRISESGIAEQTTQVLDNLESVLVGPGLNRTNVIKTTVWLKPKIDFVVFNESYAAFFGPHRPARSTVYSDLALPAAEVEIEAIAFRP
ncbi:MAG: RidA family protein [Rhizomicrobium sp.]